jgi:hypothetical protein
MLTTPADPCWKKVIMISRTFDGTGIRSKSSNQGNLFDENKDKPKKNSVPPEKIRRNERIKKSRFTIG